MRLRKYINYMLYIILIACIFSDPAVAEGLESTPVRPQQRAVLGINIANGPETGGPVEGVIIFAIAPGGGADDAGLRVEDIIVEINDVSLMAASVSEANHRLLDFMAGVAPGDDLKVVYLREGKANKATITADELDPSMIMEPGLPFMRDLERLSKQFGDEFIAPFKYRWRHHGLFAGMELVALTPGLGHYFGTDSGLLVIQAPDNEVLDLQDGDVIHEIGGRTPNNPGHAMRILRSYEPGEEVVFAIRRNQRNQAIAIRLPGSQVEAGPEESLSP